MKSFSGRNLREGGRLCQIFCTVCWGPNDRGVWVFLFGIMVGVWYNLIELLFCLPAAAPKLVGVFMVTAYYDK
jgi:hypothetical protein